MRSVRVNASTQSEHHLLVAEAEDAINVCFDYVTHRFLVCIRLFAVLCLTCQRPVCGGVTQIP